MKNIHILPTDKPSRFYSTAPTATKKEGYAFGEHYIPNTRNMFSNHNIYITSDEEIKEGDWFYNSFLNEISKMDVLDYSNFRKKIILTTDQDLIKDGVQAIDDEFLQWFVKNPSCERVEIKQVFVDGSTFGYTENLIYKIIIPKEEHKQETLEEAAENYSDDKSEQLDFIVGAKWQQEQDKNKYSEEEVLNFTQTMIMQYKFGNTNIEQMDLLKETLQLFKNK